MYNVRDDTGTTKPEQSATECCSGKYNNNKKYNNYNNNNKTVLNLKRCKQQ